MEFTASNKEVHVRDYGSAVWKHKWPALLALGAVVVPVLVYIIWIQQPIYESTAALMVNVRGGQARLLTGLMPARAVDVDTEVEMMKSPPVLARAASMIEAAGFDPRDWIPRIAWIRIEDTPVVHISAESATPELSRDVANAIGESYIDYSRRAMLESSRSGFVWLERQLAEARARMRRDEQKLQEFRRAHPKANMGIHGEFDNEYHYALMMTYMEAQLAGSTIEMQLEEYAQLLDQCGVRRPGSPKGESKVLTFDTGAAPEKLALLAALSDSERLAEISAQIDAATGALKQRLKTLKARHPDIVGLQQHLATLQSQYEAAFLTECRKGYIQRRARLVATQATAREKSKELDDYRRQFFRTTDEQSQYMVLQRNVEAGRMLHDTVLSKLKEFDLVQGAAEEGARFIQRAPPGFLKDPQNGIKIAFALLCGLLLGVGAALVAEYFDTTLKSADDVERTLELAVLGTLPESAKAARSAGDEDSDLLITLDQVPREQ